MTKRQSFHESLRARTRVKESSDRRFGLTPGMALAVGGSVRLYVHGLSAVEIGIFAFVPAGLVRRLFGKDSLGLKFDARAETYRTEKDPSARETMKYQN